MAEPAKYTRSFCNEAVNGPVSLCIRAQGEQVELAILIMTSKCSVPLQLTDWTSSPAPTFFPGLSSQQLWGHLFFKAKEEDNNDNNDDITHHLVTEPQHTSGLSLSCSGQFYAGSASPCRQNAT